MDEIYTKIQVYLLKKDKECDSLRFLTSRTTSSNAAHVSDVCNAMKTILEDATSKEMSSKHTLTETRIQHFKFLMLNTNFKSQEYLCEDAVHGHLVDMCPPLSPYLFIEIVWSLEYEDILCNSIPHIPLDLCTEILDALRRCMDVDYWRAFDLLLKVLVICYKRTILMSQQDTQALHKEESLKRFAGSIHELLSLLSSFGCRNAEGLSQLLKYERCGLILIRLLNAIKDCLASENPENVPAVNKDESQILYKLSFAGNFMVRLESDTVTDTANCSLKEMFDLLLAHIKKIDCNVYLGWAEIDYAEDTSLTMQRAIGLTCYHFTEFLEAHNRAKEYVHVTECLRQLSSSPDVPFSMSLQELCREVEKSGDNQSLRILMERYKDWNSDAISCLDRKRSSLEKGDCLMLLNCATNFFAISNCQEDLYIQVYKMIAKALLAQKLVDMMEIVVEFILMHNASNALESVNFDTDFRNYINQGLALCSNETSLRIILFFTVQNSREVLKTLIKAAIGCPKYEKSVILPKDLCKLSVIMKICDINGCLLLLNALRVICSENTIFNSKKFADLVQVLLEKNLLSADELLINVFMPVLENETNLPIILPTVNCMRFMKEKLTPKTRKHELLCVLALLMTRLRKNTSLSFYAKEEILNQVIKLIQHFAKERTNSPIEYEKDLPIERLELVLEPLDRVYFSKQWDWIRNDISLDQILQDYKRRCYYVINETKDTKDWCSNLDESLETYGLRNKDFLQHLILRCTETEFLSIMKEALIIQWNYFGWKSELDAYAQLTLTTMKTCKCYLEAVDLISSWKLAYQKVASLMNSLAKLTTWFINIDVMNDYESVYKSLVTSMSALSLSETVPPNLLQSYKELKTHINRFTGAVYSYEIVAEVVDNINKFGNQFLVENCQSDAITEPKSTSVLQFYINWTFISICVNWPMGANSLWLSKIDKKLYCTT